MYTCFLNNFKCIQEERMELHTGNKSFTSKQCLFLKPDFSLPFTPFFHGIIRRQKIFSTIGLDHIETIQITETCLLGIFNLFWDQPLIDLYEISNF